MFARRFHQVISNWEVTHVNKGELIEAIAEETQMSRAEAGRALEAVIETISNELVRGGQVALVGFGTFGTSKRNARVGKNPRTGESIKIAARTVPKFTPGKGLKDAVAGGKKGGGKSGAKGGAKAAAKGGAKSGGAKAGAKGGAKKR
jgi:DNA-binding protein HU-beta